MSKRTTTTILLLGCAAFLGLVGMRTAGKHLRQTAGDLLWRKEHDAAEARFRAAARIDPLDPGGRVGEADTLIDQVDRPWTAAPDQMELLKRATELYLGVLDDGPDNPNAWLQLARTYKLKAVAVQAQQIHDLSSLTGDMPRPLEHDLAIKAVQRALVLDPSNYVYFDYLGELQYDVDRKMALDAYQQGARVLPRLSGHAYLERPAEIPADMAAAIVRGARQAIGAQNIVNDGRILVELAQFHAQRGEYREAADVCREALDRGHPDRAFLLRRRGAWLERVGDIEPAREAFLESLTIEPDRASAHYGLALIALREGDSAEAVRQLEAARDNEPSEVRYHLKLAQVLEDAGEAEQAEASYLVALRLGGADTTSASGLVRVYRKQKRYDRALVYAKRLVELHPEEQSFQEQVRELESHLAF